MLDSNSGTHRYLSGLAFLLGAAIGCTTFALCSWQAVDRLQDFIRNWYTLNGILAPFAADIFMVALVLLFSTSVFGFFVVPVLDGVFGFGASVVLLILCQASDTPWPLLRFLPGILSMLPILRVSSLGILVSLRIARLWRSSGKRSFDLHPINSAVWLSVLLLFFLLPMRYLIELLILS